MKKRTAVIFIVLTFVAGIVGGQVGSAIAHGDGVMDSIVHACVSSRNGSIKIVGATSTCPSGTYPLDWNQTGPAGPQGLPGRSRIFCNSCTFDGLTDEPGFELFFAGQDFSDSWMPEGRFGNDAMSGADFDTAFLDRANFAFADISNAACRSARLRDANMEGVNARDADFTNADMSRANFNSANLWGANFTGADVTGARWSGAICPDGTQAAGDPPTCEGHLGPPPR